MTFASPGSAPDRPPHPSRSGAPVSRPLFILHSDSVLRERVHRAGGEHFDCIHVSSWESLGRHLEEAQTALAVVDPYAETPGRRELSPQLRTLLDRFRRVTVLAALEIRPDRFHHDLRTLGAWGVSEVIALDGDDSTENIARKIRSTQGRLMRSFIAHSLPSFVSQRGRAVLLAASEIAAGASGTGSDLAAALNLSDRALLRWCERSHLPPPRRLLAWIRVLLAAELLDYPELTVLSVADSCGYASDSSLRRAIHEFTGETPTELRQRAFATATAAFVAELRRLRGEATGEDEEEEPSGDG